MSFCRYGIPDACDVAVGGDEEGASDGAEEFSSHEFFGPPYSVEFLDFVVAVAEEFDREAVLVDEAAVCFGCVAPPAEDDGVVFFEIVGEGGEVARFKGAAGRVVFWVEVQDDPVSLCGVVGGAAQFVVLVWEAKIGCW